MRGHNALHSSSIITYFLQPSTWHLHVRVDVNEYEYYVQVQCMLAGGLAFRIGLLAFSVT